MVIPHDKFLHAPLTTVDVYIIVYDRGDDDDDDRGFQTVYRDDGPPTELKTIFDTSYLQFNELYYRGFRPTI